MLFEEEFEVCDLKGYSYLHYVLLFYNYQTKTWNRVSIRPPFDKCHELYNHILKWELVILILS